MSNGINFDECNHKWKFHLDVDKCGGPASGNTVYRCEKCKHFITLIEKSTLDQVEALKKSLKIQEKHTKIGMVANIIAAVTLIITFLVLLFGNRIISYFS